MAPGRILTALILLWLAGTGLRMTILAVPPVITSVQRDLNLSGTEIGILSGLPVILLAVAALPGSFLIARMGAVPALIIGLLLSAAGSALRGAGHHIAVLYGATIVMGAGVAIMQPSFPAVVRQWMPSRIGLATALYTNGMIVGEILPVLFAPAVLILVAGSWEWSFVFWGACSALLAGMLAIWGRRGEGGGPPPVPVRWWPDWRDGTIWRLGLMFGSANGGYFATNAFLPGYLAEVGRADLISIGLTALNVGQLPASLLLVFVAGRLERRVWPFVASGILMLICVAGVVTTASYWTILFACLLGACATTMLVLGLALPPILSAPGGVARMAASMFTVSYTEALIISVLSGLAWDIGGSARFAFLPIAIGALPLILLGSGLPLSRPAQTASRPAA